MSRRSRRSCHTRPSRARVTAAIITGTHASFSGTGFLARDAQTSVGITVDVDDVGADGSTDTFAITLTNDYSASGTLKHGNITIDQQGQQ